MATEEVLDYQSVINAVRRWSARKRFALVRDVLVTLEPPPDEAEREQQRAALRQLRGMLAHVEPKPSDEDVKRILEEERMKKYG